MRPPSLQSRTKGNEENHNKNRLALPRLCCVSGAPTACCTHQRGICHPGVELGTEECLACGELGLPGRACGTELDCRMERGGGTARLGAQRAPHPPHPLFKDGLPREPPNSKNNRFFLKVLAVNFSFCRRCLKRVVWLSDGAADPRGFLVSSLLPSVLPHVPPLREAPHFPLVPVRYPALWRLLEISSAGIWTPCLPSAMRLDT